MQNCNAQAGHDKDTTTTAQQLETIKSRSQNCSVNYGTALALNSFQQLFRHFRYTKALNFIGNTCLSNIRHLCLYFPSIKRKINV